MTAPTQPLWTLAEVQRACGAELNGTISGAAPISGFNIDSRRVQPGELFIALPGNLSDRHFLSAVSERDGHDFVAAAAEAGASAALVSTLQSASCAQLVVEDTLDALWALGATARSRLQGQAVAVTGSSGKTTAKSFMAAALSASASEGSLNNHLGVPLSLAATPRDARLAVFEVGTSSPGEIAPLARMVRPDVAVVLNVQHAHIGQFPDQAALRKEKLSLFEGLEEGGTAVLLDELARDWPQPTQLTFGLTPDADVRLINVQGDQATYQLRGRTVAAHVPGGGAHRALTLGAVLATALALEAEIEPALELSDELIPRGRGNELLRGGVVLIDDSYNANPASMSAALSALAARQGGRKLALLGEMLELGDEAGGHHESVARQAAGLDRAWLVGAGWAQPDAASADDALLDEVAGALNAGDHLLIKGSNKVFWAAGFVERLAGRLGDA